MNKKQKKIFFCVCMIFFLFLIVTIYLLKQKSPYEYLKEQKGMTAQTTANECLEEIRFDNKYIVFFINENGNLSCAVMKKKIFSYEILRISGELSQSKNSKNYLFATVYKGNIIKNLIMDCQSYTKYRPNETTGGIFVSWRRKEELPTGA